MYLKSLELHGFKSFPNRTVLSFERGATVVVGPNGSGKSNISDAMRWVLGEISSRNIRGTKMEDVIFGGTDARRPMGFAEVSVTFDNTDIEHKIDSPYDEITVTRRYYRSGESEYLINRKQVRLRDIHELFMNTGIGREGYSIIGQGRVAEMLSRKSEDRRNIFEEAAGISKYRYKKQESERKLAETEANMVRARDILNELESRVEPLEKDAERARRFLELSEEKKAADVSLWLFDTAKLRTDLAAAEEAFRLSETELSLVNEALADLERQNERLYNETQKNKLQSEGLLREIRETTEILHKLDSAYRVAENDIRHSDTLAGQNQEKLAALDQHEQTALKELEEQARRQSELTVKLQELADERLEQLAQQQELTEQIKALETELETSLSKLEEAEHHAVDLRVRIDMLRQQKEGGQSRGADMRREMQDYEKEGEKLQQEAERCEKNAAAFKLRIDTAEKGIAEQDQRLSDISLKREELNADINRHRAAQASFVQRADALRRMEEHFEGYSNSVRFVMQAAERGQIRGKVYGPVSKMIEVDSEHITAIETALGAGIQNIIVEDEGTAKAAMAALKQAGAGRATFYPLTSIRSSGETEEIRRAESFDGFVGRGDKLVRSDKKFRPIIEWLLMRTVVFDHIDHASEAARKLQYRIRLVTLDGQVINAGGSYTGGSVKRDSGMLSRGADIAKMDAGALEAAAAIQKAERELALLDDAQKKAHNARAEHEQQKELLLTMSRAQFAALDSAKARAEANDSLLAKLREDFRALEESDSRCDEEIAKLQTEFAAKNDQAADIRRLRGEREILRHEKADERDACVARASELSVTMAEVRKDLESAQTGQEQSKKRLKEIGDERENRKLQISDHRKKGDHLRAEMEENRKLYANTEKALLQLNDRRDDVESGTAEYERRSVEIHARTKERNDHKELCLRAHSKNENKLNGLREEQNRIGSRLWDDYELTYEEAVNLNYPAVTKESRAQVAAVQSSCRAKIRALGSVNVSAIEEYREVKERYETMRVQVEDLNASHIDLSGIVARIEEEMRTAFSRTFEAINDNFKIVFTELFGGGSAELLLTDPEDVLTSGIEIKAAPPGKIIKNLSLLSGGEQAFVAIALFFSILKVTPTPFCILDEIEAALDEVNVFRFGEYIKKFCAETQFVLITHRRGTMEVADRLYGVTMPERGISRVLPLQVSEIESMKKELLEDGVSK